MSLTLEDSTTYQWILKKGKIEEAHATILRLGAKRLGPPTPAEEATVRGITDHARLERLTDRLLDAAGWDELLATA